MRIKNRIDSGEDCVDTHTLTKGCKDFLERGQGSWWIDDRGSIDCGNYRWERHRVSVMASAEGAVSSGENRNLKAVAESVSVPTV
jgi:hypothetical protein